ncbi:hypothetical protein [Nocardiopsis changdeensis]|uniref:hypothetical protein n=1 Tax=Nocardiopsis changdeensis TaxID=2831969 RepID=UPI003F45E962
MRPEPNRDHRALWAVVQWEFLDQGWERIAGLLEDRPGAGAAASLGLLGVTGAVVAAAVRGLEGWVRVAAALPLVLVVFVAVGWVLLPWAASSDRRRALVPVAVGAAGCAVMAVGGWWVLAGLVVLAGAAALGGREARLTGRDEDLERALRRGAR